MIFPFLRESREDSEFFLDLSNRLGLPLDLFGQFRHDQMEIPDRLGIGVWNSLEMFTYDSQFVRSQVASPILALFR